MGEDMLGTFNDKTFLKLTEVAKELNILPETALLHIGTHCCTAVHLLVTAVIKKRHTTISADDIQPKKKPDETIVKDYVPANTQVINQIRENGEYSVNCHFVEYVDQEGLVQDTYLPTQEGQQIKATIDTLYITAHHARVLKQRKQIDDAITAKENTEITKWVSSSNEKEPKETTKMAISSAPGTEWENIKIQLKDLETLSITIGKNRPIERSYKAFECFTNKKTKEPLKGWRHFITMIAHQGNPPTGKGITVKHVSDINKNLNQIFPSINGNPFKGYKQNLGWRPKLILSISDHLYQTCQPSNQ